ncbi:MAG: InlB B-repeat-containing protein [Clostridiales bacterium]|nr:InlB B-repeat-containing protein [Clostridiales bacterium]
MKKKTLLAFLLAAASTASLAAFGCTPTGGHTHSYNWRSDAEGHWEECVDGDDAKTKEAHIDEVNNETDADGADGKCDVCGRENYTVTFDVQGHGTAPEAQIVYKDGKVTNPGLIAEAGLVFGGWYADAACTTEFDFNGTAITAPTTVYAKWSATVTFDVGGHGTAPEAQTVKLGETAVEPAEPDYGADGYVFDYWYADDEETPYDFSTPVTAELTLHACWKVDTRPLVTFNLGTEGRNKTYALQRVEEGGHATKPETDPDIDGYLFAGWYTEDGSAEFDFENTAINADTKIVAHWTVDERIMFKFDMQGHGEQIPTQKLEEGQKPTKPADPSATGYTFAGWYTNPECDGDEYDFSSEVSENTTLYAKWTVTVTFNMQGHGTAPEVQNVKVGGLVTKPEDPVSEDPDFVFVGWYRDEDCTQTFNFNTQTIESAITIYAKWKAIYPELELSTPYQTTFEEKTVLKFSFTAEEMGRYELSLYNPAAQKCYFTTDLAEDEGVFYGAGYAKDVKELDLYANKTVIITLYRPADGIEDDTRVSLLVSEINNEEFPEEGWTSGKYVGSKYTVDFNKTAKQVTVNYSDLGSFGISSYLGGSFNTAYFSVITEQTETATRTDDYTLTEIEPGTLVLKVKKSGGGTDTDTLHYVAPQAALDISAFAGTYTRAGDGVNYFGSGTIFEIVVHASGNSYVKYGSIKNPDKMEFMYGEQGGTLYEKSDGSGYNVLKLNNIILTANLSGGKVVSVNVQLSDGTGVYVYTRSGDAPKEIPKVLPVDMGVHYVGNHFMYYYSNVNYHDVSLEGGYVNLSLTGYNSETDRYIATASYYNENYDQVTLNLEVGVSGSEGNYTIVIYKDNTLYDTLNPLVFVNLPTETQEFTLQTSMFVFGQYYYFKAAAGGTYSISLSTDESYNDGDFYFGPDDNDEYNKSIHIHASDVDPGTIASFDYCAWGSLSDGDQFKVKTNDIVILHIGNRITKVPATIKIKFEKQQSKPGETEETAFDMNAEGGSKTFVASSGETYYAKFTATEAGTYKFRFSNDMYGDTVYTNAMIIKGLIYGYHPDEWTWYYAGEPEYGEISVIRDGEEHAAVVELEAGETIIIELLTGGWAYDADFTFEVFK